MNCKILTAKTAFIQQRYKSSRQQANMLALLLLMASLAINPMAIAQTEYQISTSGTNLKQEYENELNTWLLKAYEGDSEAQFRVGVLYANEQFDNPDLEQAVYWYKQAARQGHALAQYNLGHQFLTGKGVEKNESSAMQWWLEAAKNDHALSQFNIGRAYYVGIGVEQDLDKSRYWFQRAAQNDEPKSIEILRELGWDSGVTLDKPNLISKAPSSPTNQTETGAKASKQQIDEKQVVTPKPAAPTLTSRVTPIVNNDSQTATTKILPTKTQAKAQTQSTLQSDAKPAPVTNTAPKPSPVVTARNNTSDNTITKTEARTTSGMATRPVALYTNPEIKSVLITIINDRETLEIINTNKEWVTVKSPTGFPVWMHRDYLQISAGVATVTGNNVNARSVPIISKGTIVGTLDNGVQVKVLDSQNAWYRVMSPPDFVAWVKTDDYNRPAVVNSAEN